MRTVVLLLASLFAVAAVPGAETDALIDFEIEDQFKEKHRDEDFEGRVVLLLAADREGGPFCPAWGRPVHAELTPEEKQGVGFLSLAKTTGVPFFLKGTIRGKFPKEKDAWMLLDWKGEFHESYALAPDTCNALVFDRGGALVHRDAGNEPDADQVQALIDAIRGALDEGAAGE